MCLLSPSIFKLFKYKSFNSKKLLHENVSYSQVKEYLWNVMTNGVFIRKKFKKFS